MPKVPSKPTGSRSEATVLIAEDDFIIREGLLRSLLEPGYTVVASVGNGLEAVEAAANHKPNVALLDISLPGLRGFEAARQILRSNPDCKILMVSNHADQSYFDAASAMGASGYVLKSRAHRELLSAIETALSGQFFCSAF